MKSELKLVLLSAVFSAGCTMTLKAEAPEGWPELKRFEHFNLTYEELRARCGLKNVIACSVVDLCKRTCNKYYQAGGDADWIRNHEDGHCQGRDHPGESTFADALKRMDSCEKDGA